VADRRGLRQLLRRPRHILRWPLSAYGLIGGLAAVVVLAAVAAIFFLPREIPPPPTASADRWAAEGALFGAGAFVLAVLATAIATIAFVNSTDRPKLRIEPSYTWRPTPDPPSPDAIPGRFPDWSLQLSIYNDGPVAARNLAVRVTFTDPGLFAPDWITLETRDGASSLSPWRAANPNDLSPAQVWWEGGADAVVHPSPRWPYQVPQLGPAALHIYKPESDEQFEFTVELVADDVPPMTERYPISMKLLRGSE